MENIIIKRIFKKDFEDTTLPIAYTTESYYDVTLEKRLTAGARNLQKRILKNP